MCTWSQALPLLAAYNLRFVAPMIAITIVVGSGYVAADSVGNWREHHLETLHLVAGTLLVVLGIAFAAGLVSVARTTMPSPRLHDTMQRCSGRGVTPVVANVLLVALAILLATSVAVLTLAYVETAAEPAPTASFETAVGADNHLRIVHRNGDPFPTEDLYVRFGDRKYPVSEYVDGETVQAGTVIGPVYPTDETVRLVYRRGDTSAQVYTTSLPPEGAVPSFVRFDTSTPRGYGGSQNADDEVIVTTAARQLTLTNNTWQKIPYNDNVTEQTVLAFDFKSTGDGEIHGIGFETDDSISSDHIVRLLGSQDWGIEYRNYTVGDGWVHFEIPVGDLYGPAQRGPADYLAFVMDNDDGSMPSDSQFRNVRVYEDEPQAADDSLALTVNGTTTPNALESYGSQDADGNYTISNDDETVTLRENTWRYVSLNYTITTDTVLSVEFNASSEGEIHAIGLETDESESADRFLRLYGTQSWGQAADNYYTDSDGWVRYDIDLSEDLSVDGETVTHLVFVNDDDADGSGVGGFRNVTISEE